MSKSKHDYEVLESRHVTVILRLVIDQQGRVVNGEVVDVEAKLLGRFAGWVGLTYELRAWLDTQASDAPSDKLSNPS